MCVHLVELIMFAEFYANYVTQFETACSSNTLKNLNQNDLELLFEYIETKLVLICSVLCSKGETKLRLSSHLKCTVEKKFVIS